MNKIFGDINIEVKLQGYEVIKKQLNNIEKQLNRIIRKQKLIAIYIKSEIPILLVKQSKQHGGIGYIDNSHLKNMSSIRPSRSAPPKAPSRQK